MRLGRIGIGAGGGGGLVENFDLFEHFEHVKHLEHFEPPRIASVGAQKPPSEDVLPTVPRGHLARLDRLEHLKKPCAKISRKKQIRFFFLSKCKGETSARDG